MDCINNNINAGFGAAPPLFGVQPQTPTNLLKQINPTAPAEVTTVARQILQSNIVAVPVKLDKYWYKDYNNFRYFVSIENGIFREYIGWENGTADLMTYATLAQVQELYNAYNAQSASQSIESRKRFSALNTLLPQLQSSNSPIVLNIKIHQNYGQPLGWTGGFCCDWCASVHHMWGIDFLDCICCFASCCGDGGGDGAINITIIMLMKAPTYAVPTLVFVHVVLVAFRILAGAE